MIARDLNISLERYARSYHVHGEQVDTRALIPEIVRAFLDADREFQSWSRTAGDPPAAPSFRLPATAAPRLNRDLPQRSTG